MDDAANLYGITCQNSSCGHGIMALSRTAAIDKHNAIPRWRSHADTPKDSQFKWVFPHGIGYYDKRFGSWKDTTGNKIVVMKWTEPPKNLAIKH